MSTHDAQEKVPSRFMTVNEIAAELRISRASVYRLVHDGSLRGNRFGKNLRVARSVVDAYIRDSPSGRDSALPDRHRDRPVSGEDADSSGRP